MQSAFDDAAARRIGDAVRELESRSAAEVVVEIRGRSGSYAHADARFAALLALVSLAVVVFMPLTVPPVTVLLDPVAFYAVGIVIARRTPALRRLFTTERERREAVRTHAAALFHDRGLANTSGETGVLLYVSLLEQRMDVMADRGILRAVDPNDWNAALAVLHASRGIDAEAVIDAIRSLGAVLERDLPAPAVNVDELSNVSGVRLT